MGSSLIYKTIDEHTAQDFKAYKTWTFTESTIGQYSSDVNEAVYVRPDVLTDGGFGANSSGLGKRVLFDSIYNLYYRYDHEPYYTINGVSDYENRNISNRAVVVSIDNKYIGERIKPGSISILDNSNGSITIKDDGFGNLYNDTDNTAYVPSSSLRGFWSFNEGFITSGTLTGTFQNRNMFLGAPHAEAYLVRYSPGVVGYKIDFDGSSASCAVVNAYKEINFRETDDFAVSLWVWIPSSQSMTPVPDNSIVEKWDCWGGYPFVIRVLNQTYTTAADRGKIYCATWDGSKAVSLKSTTALNDGRPHHIVYQKQSSLYSLYIDGAWNNSMSLNMNQIHNDSDLYIGARGYRDLYRKYDVIYNFSGSVDELRIYSGSLTATQISTLYSKPSNTNMVGNAFYSQGLLVLTNLSGSYSNLMLAGSEFVLNFKSTVTITEHNLLATVLPSEFNMTFNPTIATVRSDTEMNYRSVVTGSEWSPYITTIGMYDEYNQLLAIAKLAKPLKKPTDFPITFAIRWDS